MRPPKPARATTAAIALLAAPALAAALVGPSASAAPTDQAPPGGSQAAANATRVYPTDVPALATIDGTEVKGGAYGSSLTPKPGSTTHFYGLTDRGPNVDAPGGKVEPLPDFQPAIGELVLRSDGTAHLVRRIGLSAHDGVPYNGQVNPTSSTNETITDLDGNTLAPSPDGYDPEGLVALPDGTFWVSDEYGPFLTHFDATGRAIERISPVDGGLPRELSEREPNRGMEGLTVTPDGKTLVGIMQSGLNAPGGPKAKSLAAIRVVTIGLSSRKVHEYLYLLHTSGSVTTAASEITAIDDHRFVVDERDGAFEPGADKKLYTVDISGATDVGPAATVGTYAPKAGGLLVGGRTVEAIAGANPTDATAANLAAAGITPGTSKLFLDVAGLVSAVDPSGGYFGHDKVEGVALLDHARTVVISNDNDFGISGVNEAQPPYTLKAKILPDGQQDDGALLVVDRTKVPAQYRGRLQTDR